MAEYVIFPVIKLETHIILFVISFVNLKKKGVAAGYREKVFLA